MKISAGQSSYYYRESFCNLVSTREGLRKNTFLIFQLNARGLKNKPDELELYINSLNDVFDVLAFTETWFTDDRDAV